MSLVIHSAYGKIGYLQSLTSNKAIVSHGDYENEYHPSELEKIYNPSINHLMDISCVIISKQTDGKQKTGCGMGINNNTILTTAENICDKSPLEQVVNFVKKIYVISNNYFSEAEIIQIDFDANLAVLKTNNHFELKDKIHFDVDDNPPYIVPDSIGDKVVIAKTNDKHKNLHFEGHITQNPHQIYFNANSPKLTQIEASETSMYSGSPIVDSRYKVVVGMTTNVIAPHKGDGLNFMIPAEFIYKWLLSHKLINEWQHGYSKTEGHPKMRDREYMLVKFREKDFIISKNDFAAKNHPKTLRANTKNDGFKNHEAWINEKNHINELLNKSGIVDLLDEYIFIEE